MKIKLENRTAKLANLLSTTEKAGKKDVPALELKLEFENVGAEEVVLLLDMVELPDFKASFWDEGGDPLFHNLGDQKIERLPDKQQYRIECFNETNDVAQLKDWAFVPTGGHRCRLSCTVRVLNYGKNFCWQTNQHQRRDIPDVTLTLLSEELDL